MQRNLYQISKESWQKWMKEKPSWFLGTIALILCLIYYLAVIYPFSLTIDNLKQQIIKNQNDALWMIKTGKVIANLRAAAIVPLKSTESIFTIVNQSINLHGLKKQTTGVQQTDQNSVQVTFDALPYPALMKWLSYLHTTYAINVTQATLNKTNDKTDSVHATIILKANK